MTRRPRMGQTNTGARPKEPATGPASRRTIPFKFLATPAEEAEIRRRIEQSGRCQADYLRDLAMTGGRGVLTTTRRIIQHGAAARSATDELASAAEEIRSLLPSTAHRIVAICEQLTAAHEGIVSALLEAHSMPPGEAESTLPATLPEALETLLEVPAR